MDDRAHSVKPVERGARRAGPPDRFRSGNASRLIGMILLAIARAGWLAWFLIEPLPNTNNTAGASEIAVRRGWLVLKALPHVVPETSFRESILGQGARRALPRREPAPACADRSDGLADRGRGGRAGRPGVALACGSRAASGWASAWRSATAWERGSWAC